MNCCVTCTILTLKCSFGYIYSAHRLPRRPDACPTLTQHRSISSPDWNCRKHPQAVLQRDAAVHDVSKDVAKTTSSGARWSWLMSKSAESSTEMIEGWWVISVCSLSLCGRWLLSLSSSQVETVDIKIIETTLCHSLIDARRRGSGVALWKNFWNHHFLWTIDHSEAIKQKLTQVTRQESHFPALWRVFIPMFTAVLSRSAPPVNISPCNKFQECLQVLDGCMITTEFCTCLQYEQSDLWLSWFHGQSSIANRSQWTWWKATSAVCSCRSRKTAKYRFSMQMVNYGERVRHFPPVT